MEKRVIKETGNVHRIKCHVWGQRGLVIGQEVSRRQHNLRAVGIFFSAMSESGLVVKSKDYHQPATFIQVSAKPAPTPGRKKRPFNDEKQILTVSQGP